MTWDHTDAISYFPVLLQPQLDRRQDRVHVTGSRLRQSGSSYYIPDVAVILTEFGRDLHGRPDRLEVFAHPLPLVVEVWSPSTGDYDTDTKIPLYQ